MRDRAKILVGNREVAKRYIGSRLVWEKQSGPAYFETVDNSVTYINNGQIFITKPKTITDYTEIKGIRINNKEPFFFKTERFRNEVTYQTYIPISTNEKGLKEYLGFAERTFIRQTYALYK